MRVLFSGGAGHSHIAPLVPLAAAARDSGHQVVFVTGPDVAGHAAGFDVVGIGPPTTAAVQRYRRQYPMSELVTLSTDDRLAHVVAHLMVEIGAAGRVDEMVAYVRRWKPDLVVAAASEFASVMAAAVSGIPYVVHAVGPPKSAAVMAAGWRAASRVVGLDEIGHDVPYLDLWPQELRPGGVEWDHRTPWPLRPESVLPVPGPRPAVLDGLPFERTVYVTAGTTHNTRPGVLTRMLAPLLDEGVNVVITSGRDHVLAGPWPDHVRVEQFVPQERLLPHVDVVVCHAGAGTVLGALAHGVPLVLRPLATDQFDAADHVAAAGAGVVVGDDPVGAFREVRDDSSYREAAKALAERIAAMPSPAEVVRRLEAHFGPRPPV